MEGRKTSLRCAGTRLCPSQQDRVVIDSCHPTHTNQQGQSTAAWFCCFLTVLEVSSTLCKIAELHSLTCICSCPQQVIIFCFPKASELVVCKAGAQSSVRDETESLADQQTQANQRTQTRFQLLCRRALPTDQCSHSLTIANVVQSKVGSVRVIGLQSESD